MVLLLCLLVLHSEMAHAATYTVGGAGGWTFNTVGWPKGKRFRAGDTLGQYLSITINSISTIKGLNWISFQLNSHLYKSLNCFKITAFNNSQP